jgi:ankyrin repeat protein
LSIKSASDFEHQKWVEKNARQKDHDSKNRAARRSYERNVHEYYNSLMSNVKQGNFDSAKKRIKAIVHSDVAFNPDYQNSEGLTPLMIACSKNNPDMVDLLLRNNFSIDLQDKKGNTALMLAVQKGNLEIVKAFLNKNPNLDLKNKKGNTALDIAKSRLIFSKNRKAIITALENASSFI